MEFLFLRGDFPIYIRRVDALISNGMNYWPNTTLQTLKNTQKARLHIYTYISLPYSLFSPIIIANFTVFTFSFDLKVLLL